MLAPDDEVLREGVRVVERVLDEESRWMLQQYAMLEQSGRLVAFTLAALITILGLFIGAGYRVAPVPTALLAAGTISNGASLAVAVLAAHALGMALRVAPDPAAVRAACMEPGLSKGGLLASVLESHEAVSAFNLDQFAEAGRRRSFAVRLWLLGATVYFIAFCYILVGAISP